MGALIGLMAGLGLLLIGWTFAEPGWRPARRSVRRTGRIADLLARAGVEGVSPAQVVAMCGIAFVLAAVALTAASGVPAIGVIFGLMAACAAHLGAARTCLAQGRASMPRCGRTPSTTSRPPCAPVCRCPRR